MGRETIYPKPNLSAPNRENRIYPYLLRGLKAAYPNPIWGIDIAYTHLQGRWMSLVALLDGHSRYVVSWKLDQTLEMPFVRACVDSALARAAHRFIADRLLGKTLLPAHRDQQRQCPYAFFVTKNPGRLMQKVVQTRLFCFLKNRLRGFGTAGLLLQAVHALFVEGADNLRSAQVKASEERKAF